MDVDALITGLVKANSVPLGKLQNQATNFRIASSTLSSIGSALGGLQSAATALSTTTGSGGMTATSNNAAVVVSANGGALPASYEVTVENLASEQRTYSQSFSSNSGALAQTGNFTIKIGSGTAKQIDVLATDSLDAIAGKINQAGIRATASVFYDGSKYRLQVRGLDTGDDNALAFVETGTTLDLNGDGSTPTGGKTVQQAKNANLTIDGFTVSRPTNQIIGAAPGVTFALTAKTTTAAAITVASDSQGLQTKLSALVSSYNTIIKASHNAAGFGTTVGQVDELKGDSTLRSITQRLNAAITTKSSGGTGAFQTLQDIGLSLDRNGMLALDSAKLSKALTADSASVVNLMARTAGSSNGGLVAKLADVATTITDSNKGILTIRNDSLLKQAKKLDTRALQEQSRLDSYADRLRKSLGDMDAKVGANKVMLQALSGLINHS
jgi:flagellar hook-associated protein 2